MTSSNQKVAEDVVAKARLTSDAVVTRAGVDAREVISKAHVTADALVASNMITEGIEDEISATTKRLDDHMNHDNERFSLAMSTMATKQDLATATSLLATKEDLRLHAEMETALLSTFATRDDIKDWVKMSHNIETAQAIGHGVSKTVLWLAGFIIAGSVVWAFTTGAWTRIVAAIYNT